MNWPLLLVLVTSLSGFITVGMSNVLFYRMVREINNAVPEDQRMNLWTLGMKSRRVFKQHRELFPNSVMRSKMGWLSAVGLVLFCGGMIFGMFATNAGWIKN
jgi:hypothetical protein